MTDDWIDQNREMLDKLRKAMKLLEGYGEIILKYHDGKLVDFRIHPSIKVR